MLIVGILIMYHTKAFWGLENNSNAATLNATMNFVASISFYPLIIMVVVVVLAMFLLSATARGFG